MAAQVVRIFADVIDYDGEIARAAELVRAGNVVVLPTETVYGAATLLTAPGAINRLREIRGGAVNKPFTIHLANREQASHYIGETNNFAQRLMRKLWPGPVGL